MYPVVIADPLFFIRAMLQQQLRNLCVSIPCSHLERSQITSSPYLHVRSALEQQPREIDIAIHHRPDQGSSECGQGIDVGPVF